MANLEIPPHLAKARAERAELEQRLSDPNAYARPEYRETAQRFARVQDLIRIGEEWEKLATSIAEMEEMRNSDLELRDQLTQAIEADRPHLDDLAGRFRRLLAPPDPNDEKNAIIEIRAGTGGEESSLFAADLLRMYARFAEKLRLKTSLLDSHPTPLGGFKQLTFSVEGKGAYSVFRYESGVHRVQRVPETEAQGRIHTSTASVVVLPEAEDVEIEIDPNDLRIETFRSQGPGGQSVNTTDSAVRITHVPTGIVASCQDEKSQMKNRTQAMRVLRARLHDLHEQKKQATLKATRRAAIGTAERSEKIRTYNYPQNRITDHRIGLSLYDLTTVLEGNMEPLAEALRSHEADSALEE
ncbi:MAG: peptide chain release factor 1 [bacterium]|jgi:peptide chain release factor 1